MGTLLPSLQGPGSFRDGRPPVPPLWHLLDTLASSSSRDQHFFHAALLEVLPLQYRSERVIRVSLMGFGADALRHFTFPDWYFCFHSGPPHPVLVWVEVLVHFDQTLAYAASCWAVLYHLNL
jgi:hypothetical protein